MESTNLRFSVLVFFCIYFFISGADGYIILPTAWYYIESLGFSASFYGAVLGARSLGFIIFSPISGKFADKTRKVKLILLVCVTVKVIAYLIYAIPTSGYCPLVGVFLSGAANAAYCGMYGDVVRYTEKTHRSTFFLVLDSTFAVGASCGPVFGSFITFKTNILGWNIYDGNSPGIILAVAWFLALCVLMFIPSDSGTAEISNEFSLIGTDNGQSNRTLNSTLCCVFHLLFSNNLISVTCSGILLLLSMELFHLKLIHVKLVFVVGMLFVLLAYVVTYIATTHFNERSILVLLMILQIPSIICLFIYAFVWTNVLFSLSYTLVIFACFGMPQVCFAVSGALLSKITPIQHASTVQSFLIVDVIISDLVGRGLSGFVFCQTRLITFSVVLLLQWFVSFAWFSFVFHRLPVTGGTYE